jgi:hypothetical protein
MVRTACLREIGGFDDGFGSYAEDLDLCLRAGDAGWTVGTVLDATGHGLGSASSERIRLAAINTALLVAKRHGRVAGWRMSARYVGRVVRGAVMGAVALHRPRDRRRASWRRSAATANALAHLARTGGIRDYSRDPGARVARFS